MGGNWNDNDTGEGYVFAFHNTEICNRCSVLWYTIEEQIPFCERERGKDTRMTVDRRVSSIESSFKMESMPFDAECRQRVRNVLTKKVSATDAISELNKKYRVSKKKVEGSRV